MANTLEFCGCGKWCVDIDEIIKQMPMTNFRKWSKLFIKHGRTDQHDKFFDVLSEYISEQATIALNLEAELSVMQLKAERRIRTELAPEWCKEEVKRLKRHVNGAKKNAEKVPDHAAGTERID